MGDQPESSSQALERFLSTQLASLSLTVPSDDVEYMSRFVEEDGLDRSEKVEGVRGMLEGVVEGGELPEAELDEALGQVVDEWDRLQAEEEERKAQEAAERSPTPPDPKTILSTLTPEEIEAARRQAILRQYAYVEGGPEDEAATRDKNAPPKADTAKTAAEKKAAEERRSMIEAALKLDGKKKKYKKQQEVDLLAPNLNKDKMIYMAQMEREAAKKGAQAKKERDRLALEKQKADIAKAKADKQKKAAKQERRA